MAEKKIVKTHANYRSDIVKGFKYFIKAHKIIYVPTTRYSNSRMILNIVWKPAKQVTLTVGNKSEKPFGQLHRQWRNLLKEQKVMFKEHDEIKPESKTILRKI